MTSPHSVESFGDPKAFYEPGRMLSQGGRQSMCRLDVFATLPRFHRNMPESENLVCSATTGTKTALGIIRF